MTGFGAFCSWKDGCFIHGGIGKPESKNPRHELIYKTFSSNQVTNLSGASETQVYLSHHVGCVIKV